MRLNEDLLLSLLLLEDTLDLLDLYIEGVKKGIAPLNLKFFLLQESILILKVTSELVQFFKNV